VGKKPTYEPLRKRGEGNGTNSLEERRATSRGAWGDRGEVRGSRFAPIMGKKVPRGERGSAIKGRTTKKKRKSHWVKKNGKKEKKKHWEKDGAT